MHILHRNELYFPPASDADEDGLLAIGGDLSSTRIMHAYHNGIFPWFAETDPICWWSPDPRFVLFSKDLKVSKSMRQLLGSGKLTFTINRAFDQVIHHCKKIYRPAQDGTWLSDKMEAAYIKLHREGWAHSAETWEDGKLVGGLYGLKLPTMFCGESMFSLSNNASKFALINYSDALKKEGITLIDCQVPSAHLGSMGAKPIPRDEFLSYLPNYTG